MLDLSPSRCSDLCVFRQGVFILTLMLLFFSSTNEGKADSRSEIQSALELSSYTANAELSFSMDLITSEKTTFSAASSMPVETACDYAIERQPLRSGGVFWSIRTVRTSIVGMLGCNKESTLAKLKRNYDSRAFFVLPDISLASKIALISSVTRDTPDNLRFKFKASDLQEKDRALLFRQSFFTALIDESEGDASKVALMRAALPELRNAYICFVDIDRRSRTVSRVEFSIDHEVKFGEGASVTTIPKFHGLRVFFLSSNLGKPLLSSEVLEASIIQNLGKTDYAGTAKFSKLVANR